MIHSKRFKTSYLIYIAVLITAVVLIAVFIRSNRVEPAPVIIPPHEDPAELDLNGYTLSWCDDFDGGKIDSSKWRGFSCGEEESVIRQGGWWHTDLASVKDGNLHISTQYFKGGYKGGKAGWYSCGLCTSGLFEQNYGYFEVRCILPKGDGMWAAFWMLPFDFSNTVGNGGKDGAEIDVFESPNYRYRLSDGVNVVTSNLHIDGYGKEEQSECVATPFIEGNDPYAEFNTYGVEWKENEYIFYINGIESGRSDFGGVSQVPEYLLLTVEVGGSKGKAKKSWAGNELPSDAVPSDFIVDYVRVYTR